MAVDCVSMLTAEAETWTVSSALPTGRVMLRSEEALTTTSLCEDLTVLNPDFSTVTS
jgi:hypothetical protein